MIKKDIQRRHRWLNVVNPLYAAFYFAWALGITYFDAVKYGVADPTVFMTFSLTVPLSFFLFPIVYTVIVVLADAFMIYILATVSGSIGPMINLSIFVIFQLVLGISFFRVKMKLADRIVREHENAEMDVLTGFANRRAYEKDMRKMAEEQPRDGLVYLALDINELKEVNDAHGHEAGDRLIVGTAECIERCFGDAGSMYRIGGDEFAVLICMSRDDLERRLGDYERRLKAWSEQNDLGLSTACGYACLEDCPDESVMGLARMADMKMYEAKSRYYRENGRDRRRYSS